MQSWRWTHQEKAERKERWKKKTLICVVSVKFYDLRWGHKVSYYYCGFESTLSDDLRGCYALAACTIIIKVYLSYLVVLMKTQI